MTKIEFLENYPFCPVCNCIAVFDNSNKYKKDIFYSCKNKSFHFWVEFSKSTQNVETCFIVYDNYNIEYKSSKTLRITKKNRDTKNQYIVFNNQDEFPSWVLNKDTALEKAEKYSLLL